MKHSDKLFNQIAEGMAGQNIGVPTGLDKLDEIIAGIQRATIYDVAAASGAGKTSLALYAFIYQPLKQLIGNINFRIIYYSLEMSAEVLLAKLLSLYIYDMCKVEISYKKLMSRTGKSRLNAEEYELVKRYKPWVDAVEDSMEIYDKALTTEGLYRSLKNYSNTIGKFEEHETGESFTVNPTYKDRLTLIIIDHIGLLKRKQGQSLKEAIDTAVSELIYFRNKCGYSAAILQQLNRTSESMDRRKAEMQEVELQDLKDSAGPSEGADVVLSIFFPHRSKMTSYRKYNIARGFRDRFRSIIVLKNRYGDADQVVPVNFFGSIGLFKELDEPEKYESITDYGPYLYLFPPVKPDTIQYGPDGPESNFEF